MPIPYDSHWFIILFGLAFQIYPNTSSPQKKYWASPPPNHQRAPRYRRYWQRCHHVVGPAIVGHDLAQQKGDELNQSQTIYVNLYRTFGRTYWRMFCFSGISVPVTSIIWSPRQQKMDNDAILTTCPTSYTFEICKFYIELLAMMLQAI